MSKKVAVENLASEIAKMFNEYVDDIDDIVEQEVDRKLEEAKEELQIISPKKNNGYAKGWKTGTREKSKRKYSKVVYNAKKYNLTHLLEFGHINRDGTTRAVAKPHIRKTEEKFGGLTADAIERNIRR